MAEIDVQRSDIERFMSRFQVTVTEGGRTTHHEVTLSAADFERLGGNYRSPDEFVRACFDFLLEREPKESILASFDVSVISTYFPDFEKRILRF
jgi:hypothetical protein